MNNSLVETDHGNNKKYLLIFIALFVFGIICALVITVLSFFGIFTLKPNNDVVVKNNVNTTNTTETLNTTNSTESQVETPKAAIKKTFVGTYVTAKIPQDWSIVEYSTKDGMDQFVDNGSTFSGLTGLEILDETNTVVFSLGGVDGIGGSGGCSTVGRFADTDASYIDSIKNETDVVGFGPTEVLDLTSVDYSEINTLNLRFRRVDNLIYVAKNFSPSFNTACGIEDQFVKIDELKFTITDGIDTYSANAYKFKINSLVTSESTLQKLDEVLNSLEAKNIS